MESVEASADLKNQIELSKKDDEFSNKLSLSEFQIRPPLAEKFKSMMVKEIIRTVLNEELTGKVYHGKDCEIWVKNVVSGVYAAVKELNFPRYKIIVQSVIGEHRGSGVKIGTRCLWDADTDSFASDSFFNDSLFCNVVVFAIYCY